MMELSTNILTLFNAMVVDKAVTSSPVTTWIDRGFVTDFEPTADQLYVLTKQFKPLDLRTLFTVEERENADLNHLLAKQVLHYIEVYGFGLDGNLTVPLPRGHTVTVKAVHGITVATLGSRVRKLIYANAPVKDALALRDIISAYGITYDINQIQNNELRVSLFRPALDVFTSGDDAVRWMCLRATESPLLIKSSAVINAVMQHFNTNHNVDFFVNHRVPLAQVFNRHKKLILAAKNSNTKTAINRIARDSKRLHVPVQENPAKRFISDALGALSVTKTGLLQCFESVASDALKSIALRDKLKYLNLLEYKKLGRTTDAFTVRNGKVHIETGRKAYYVTDVLRVGRAVVDSLSTDLNHLREQRILLDPNVHYGLPVSRKQTVGHLPYGTTIEVGSDKISAGIYWEDAGGARDLDLSTIDEDGQRVGWGYVSSYGDGPITFSGDVTRAPEGAMEFMTSASENYGLFVNIFSGEVGCKMELVVGTFNNERSQWIDEPIIREKHQLDSKGCLLGYVDGKTFRVYGGRVDSSTASFSGDTEKAKALAARGTHPLWTVTALLDSVGIEYDIERDPLVEYDHDLSYESFSFDKLEALLVQ